MNTLLDRHAVAGSLLAKAELALDRARQLGRPMLVTHAEPLPFNADPLAFLTLASTALGDGALWMQPRTQEYFAGAGSAISLSANSSDRFAAVTAALGELRQTIVGATPSLRFPLLGGFAFNDMPAQSGLWDDFPGGRLIVPRVLLQTVSGKAHIRVTGRVEPWDSALECCNRINALLTQCQDWLSTSTASPLSNVVLAQQHLPDRAEWESTVARAVSVIRHGRIDKVVLARELRLLADAPFAPLAILSRLQAANSQATIFALQSGGSWFLGATPERLVRLVAGQVEVNCLAGSIASGQSEEERQALALQLLASRKDREEHEIVVRSTLSALEEICEDVTRLPDTPLIAVARGVQHLESPLTARLSAEGQVLDLVARLHPTPAVGGYPRAASLNLLRELETIERGWYAGPFGWTDLSGSGEFAVAIRSALISGRTASVFAGSGIVAGSIPAAEFDETELKMRPMLAALGAL